MKNFLLLLVLSLVCATHVAAESTAVLHLANLFEPGVILKDRNGDEVIDFVDARIVIGEQATAADIASAADVAARLGFETTALDLFGPGGDLPIVIGTAGMLREGIPDDAIDLTSLAPGEGTVRIVASGDGPAVVIAGRDNRGTRAAAQMFAGRLPFVWDHQGTTLAGLVKDFEKFLSERKIDVQSVRVPSIRVVSGKMPGALEGIEVIVLEIVLGADENLLSAEAALRDLEEVRVRDSNSSSLSYAGVRRVLVRLSSPTMSIAVDVFGDESVESGPRGRRPGSGVKDRLDLSNLFKIDGLLGDANDDLIPDRVDAVLVATGTGIEGVVDLAARIGLEATGISIPIAYPPSEIENPASAPTLVLIGNNHPLIDGLVSDQKFTQPDFEPGEGLIHVVRKAYGEKSALIITGADASGTARAIQQVGEKFPHIWDRGKDRTTVADIEEEVWRFLSARSPAGQAATALYKLDVLLAELPATDLESASVTIYVEKPEDGLVDLVRQHVETRLDVVNLEVAVEPLDVENAKSITVGDVPVGAEFEIPSEVDKFWKIFNSLVIPAVEQAGPEDAVVVETRLSEPPEVRKRLEQQIRKRLIEAGARTSSITVLSAYKQGYSWLYDVIRPKLVGQDVGHVSIRFSEIGPPPDWTQQAMYAPTRWLLEIFPIDEVLANELSLDLSQITFEKMPIGSPAYEVIVVGTNGQEILRQAFEPKFVTRPYFDRFPDYERVRVTTGWIEAKVGDQLVVDQRVVTDPEYFWDYFQSTTLPAIYDYVMELHGGKPLASDAPHFGKLVVELSLSEPDYRVGVDLEQISSVEALHEEIYFGTLHFFDVLGRYSRGKALNYPGRVIPIVRATSDGRPGRAKLTFTGFGARRPSVDVSYVERTGHRGRLQADVPRVDLAQPEALSARVRDGVNGLQSLNIRVKVQTEKDERTALIQRAHEDQVDRLIMSAVQTTQVLEYLNKLREAGLYREALAYHNLANLQISATWEHEIDLTSQRVAVLRPNGNAEVFPDIASLLPFDQSSAGDPIVQWDTPIPPDEAYSNLALMSEFKEATAYRLGRSYLGREIWAMDLMSPLETTHWSQAKVSVSKPTVVYSARQHANEVSSTSHVLKFAEELLRDDTMRDALLRVNVVIHPITNPDGAQLAYDLYKITPDQMLHAGYLGSLGVDVTTDQWSNDPIYPESAIRRRLWRTWLPDIFLNPHGYPSHEWVQLFSEYAGWVRNRVTRSRDWWGMRGWFMPGFRYLDDPKYPRHKAAAFRIREIITTHINAVDGIRALNKRAYARYRRYGFDHDPENFKLDFTNDVLIYSAIRGETVDPSSRDFMFRHPKVTVWTGSTEAPDETVSGDWLHLVASAGLQWDKAVLRYLLEGNHTIERESEPFYGGIALKMSRSRPPKPMKTLDNGNDVR